MDTPPSQPPDPSQNPYQSPAAPDQTPGANPYQSPYQPQPASTFQPQAANPYQPQPPNPQPNVYQPQAPYQPQPPYQPQGPNPYQPQSPYQPQGQSPYGFQPQSPYQQSGWQPPRKSNAPIFVAIGIVVVLVACLVGVAGLVVISQHSSSTPGESAVVEAPTPTETVDRTPKATPKASAKATPKHTSSPTPFGNNPNHAGLVLFTTTVADSVGNGCTIKNSVTTVTLGQPVYANYFLTHEVSEAATVEVTLNGDHYGSIDFSQDDISGYDCLEGTEDLSYDLTEVGVYDFILKTNSGETLAEGLLLVTD